MFGQQAAGKEREQVLKNSQNIMTSDLAIKVENVSKTFVLPHEKIDTMKGMFVNLFKQKTYEEFKALNNVSFEVKKGEFLGIIGRNGSGKSTLLKILAGIYKPDRGKLTINGLVSPFLELGIGFHPELSGRDNIYLNACVLGLNRKEIDKKFDEIVAFSELERFIDQKIKNYSSGMQVRLAFAVSIHANRDILLMDEVLAVGDNNFQQKCLEEFNHYRVLGKTVILVTHDLPTVERYCDLAMLLREGNVEKIGNPQEVCYAYIHQNISDTETRTQEKDERIQQEEKREGALEKDRKIAAITRVDFLDGEGNKKNVFKTGDDMSIRVHFNNKTRDRKLNFGVAIYNQEGNYLSGINTILDKIDTNHYIKQGYFQVHYKNIPFKTNTYYVKAGIFGKNDRTVYDFLDMSKKFSVVDYNRNQGLIELNYEWV